MMKKFLLIGMMLLIILVIIAPITFAANGTGEYLQQVQEPQSASPSGFSVFAYVFSLLFTFGVVLALAYFTSKFWGSKFNQLSKNNNNKVLRTLSLGQHRAVYVVEIVDEYFVLGVTDHNITLLHKITSQEQIEQLKAQNVSTNSENFEVILRRQLNSLKDMSSKFPGVFGSEQQIPSDANPSKNHLTDVEKR
jgi:flagellar protein FliO/FliZ